MSVEPDAPSKGRRAALAVAPLLACLGLGVLFWYRLQAGDASKLPSALIGRAAPPLPATELDGASDPNLSAGKVTVVNVFGSWCGPCHEEHPALLSLATDADVKAGKVSLVGVAQKDRPDNVRRFLGVEGNPYGKVVLDPDGRAGIDWGVYGVPETFVIKGDGTIAYKFVGPLTEDTLRSVLLPEIRKAEG